MAAHGVAARRRQAVSGHGKAMHGAHKLRKGEADAVIAKEGREQRRKGVAGAGHELGGASAMAARRGNG